jgi:NAD(P)-dependent dehydrogenase (short-subunit alcohol dehydrogenase family)
MKDKTHTESERDNYPLAIVTGAAHRIGREFALQLARQGYAILLHFHSSTEKVFQTADEIYRLGVPVFPVQADLRDETQVRSLFDQVDTILDEPGKRVSKLEVLVNSAAVMPGANIRTMGIEDFDAVINLNLRAPLICSQLAFTRMGKSGLIVNISDIAAQKTWIGFPAYSVSKAALDSLTRILARSFAPGVRVNAIAPGLALASENMAKDDWERLINRTPLHRAASLNEISSALEFLLKNEYITGQTIVIDGGYSLI